MIAENTDFALPFQRKFKAFLAAASPSIPGGFVLY